MGNLMKVTGVRIKNIANSENKSRREVSELQKLRETKDKGGARRRLELESEDKGGEPWHGRMGGELVTEVW